MEEKITVIIPVYNRIETLERAIESVLGQSLRNFKLIVIDDCSTVNVEKSVLKFKDPRIFFFRLKENSGAAAARNYGIKACATPFISFLDSDDTFEPNFLELSYNHLSQTSENVGFMWTGVRIFKGDLPTEHQWEPKKFSNSYLTFLHDIRIGTGAGITIKREVFTNCGYFRENLPAAEDTEFFLRITKKYDYTYIRNVLINIYKSNSDRMSVNFKNVAIAYNLFLVEHLDEIEKNQHMKVKYFYKLMWLNYNLSDKKKAREFYRKIPKSNLMVIIKSLFTFSIYEIFPLPIAVKIHVKFT